MFLNSIGADSRIYGLFQAHAAAGVGLARVVRASHELYTVRFEEGEAEAVPSGRLRREGELPAVGDWVAARSTNGGTSVIDAVLPRRTWFSRRAAGGATVEQVIAANVDLAVVVCGLDGDFNLRRLERYLVLAHESGAEALIVLNKADVCERVEERVEQVRRIANGVRVLPLTARTDVSPLAGHVRGATSVLLGSSGAGKSTIVNGLLHYARQATGAVRGGDDRGRHTTTVRMLLALPEGGAIIDTPGLRELQLWASEDSLAGAFAEVEEIARQCRFGDCSHTGEPGCAVAEALQRGEIDAQRWQSFLKLRGEAKRHRLEQDAIARLAEKRKLKALHKMMRRL